MRTILARTLALASAALLPAFAGNQILLRNLNSADGTPKLLAAGTSGQLYVLSTLTAGQQITRVVELDLTGARLASLDLTQLSTPNAVTVDPQGNVIIAGFDQSNNGTVWKVDPKLAGSTNLASLPANLKAVTTDASGNIYVTGVTSSASFPVTAGAYQITPPGTGFFGYPAYTFLTEISPAGKVVYSTYFGSDGTSCVGGSYCVGKYGITVGTAIAVDSSGAVVIAGTTTATGLPTTPGVLGSTCLCGYSVGIAGTTYAGFAAKFQPGAAHQLVWSTFLNASENPATSLTVSALALDAAGNVVIGGGAPPGLPTTAGAFQIPNAAAGPNGGAYLLKLNNTATAAVWGAYFGDGGAVSALYLDSQQRVVFGGSIGNSFVARVSGDGATVGDYYQGPAAYPALANVSTGGFAAVFSVSGALWIETAAAGPSLLNIADSASGHYSSSLTGVELISLYGAGIGPATALVGQVVNNVYTSSLGGYQVLFNGAPAPLLYAGPGQINTIVPSGVGLPQHIQIATPAGTIDGPTVPISPVPVYGVFQEGQNGLAAALNQNSSINSASNPAAAGTIVAVFATSSSGTYFPDGAVVPLELYEAALPVWVVDSYRSLEVVWAGAAPGVVAGVLQINFRLPNPLPTLTGVFEFSVIIGGGAAVQGQVAVAQ